MGSNEGPVIARSRPTLSKYLGACPGDIYLKPCLIFIDRFRSTVYILDFVRNARAIFIGHNKRLLSEIDTILSFLSSLESPRITDSDIYDEWTRYMRLLRWFCLVLGLGG